MKSKNGQFLIVLVLVVTAWPSITGGITINSAMASTGSLIFTSSNGTSTPSALDSTSVIVSPNSTSVNQGASNTFTITVADTSNSANIPTGTISLTDNNAGGTFNPQSCILSSGTCVTSYTISQNSPNTITITASYGGDTGHSTSVGMSTLMIHHLNPTSTTITPASTNLPSNNTLTFSVQVGDTSSSPTQLSGTVTFSDGNNGGTFNPTSCAWPIPKCVSVYTAPVNSLNVITVNATYSGDGAHSASFALSHISTSSTAENTTKTTSAPDTTVTAVKTNLTKLTSGSQVVVTASVTDTSNPSSSMIGIISWSDEGAGGTFTPNNCILTNNGCSITYMPPSNLANNITITATYAGDTAHAGSSGTVLLSVPATQQATTLNATTNQSSNPTTSNPSTPSPSASSPSAQSAQTSNTPPSQSATPSPTQSSPSQSSNPTTSNPSTPSPSASSPSAQSAQTSNTPPSQSATPSPTPSSTTTQYTPNTATQSTPSTTKSPSSQIVNKVVSTPESFFDKLFTMIENLFKKV